MRAILFTLNVILLSSIGVLAYQWPPALFAFLVLGPLSLISMWGISEGHVSGRTIFVTIATFTVGGIVAASYFFPAAWYGLAIVGPLIALGILDMLQTKRAIRRNFPVIGHMRYIFEGIRPEIQQYFIESNTDGKPFAREDRSVVYQRSKGQRDTVPFGTQRDVYVEGYEWINHSMVPVVPEISDPRVRIGGDRCSQPYDASLLNISAMSFGSLSPSAVRALNIGAREGGFAHNTGEGSISKYHEEGGDLIWQIGTGYFGCRTEYGDFDPEKFRERATLDAVKMIELKLSQGAKPGHGGILPASKITPEIAAIREVPLGQDVISPPAHRAFSTPKGLLEFIDQLRELSGGKPVGFKLCVGKRREFLAICKAMLETGIKPDFIAVDGGEGGTGAAPVEFSNSLGCPLVEGLTFVHNALVGCELRDEIKVIASGKVASGFEVVRMLAVGADLCYSARAMMMAMGCIQARKCNNNECPVGITTQNPSLIAGLVVDEKSLRVKRYHDETIEAAMDLMGAAGIDCPTKLHPWHIMRRISAHETRHYGQIFEYLEPGALTGEAPPESFARAWRSASAETFDHVSGDAPSAASARPSAA